ncbi:uncharacterized protein CBL_12074 [Carabus blaptoides fortunei]
MHLYQFVVSISAIISFASTVPLQSYFKQCKRNDPDLNQCIEDSFNSASSEFIKADSRRHLASLSPLYVPCMYIDVHGNLQINMTENYLTGFDTVHINRVNWDWNKKIFDVHVMFDYTTFAGNYDIHGQLMILPIYGNGKANITFVKPDYHFTGTYAIKARSNKEYINLQKCTLPYTLDRAFFKFENLYNNSESSLGKQMSKILDENWKEVNAELKANIGDGLAEVFCGFFQAYFEKVSLNELFA